MITYIQLKQVIRNKRFLMFTVFIPVCWYFIISNIQDVLPTNIALGIAVFIGIIGNSLATFSKRISSEKNFFSFYSKISDYTMGNYLLSQIIVQLFLNSGIFIIVAIFGFIFFNLQFSVNLLMQFVLLNIMGIYFSCYGFLIGSNVSSKIIDTVSFPVIILASLTIVPFSQITTQNNLLNIITKVQKIFPGYYYNEFVSNMISKSTLNIHNLLLFFVVVVLNLVPVYLLVVFSSKKVKRNIS